MKISTRRNTMLVQPQMRRTSSLIIRRTSSLPKVLSYVTLVLILTWYSHFCNRLQNVSNNLWEYGTLSQNQNQNRNRTSFEHSKKCKLVNKQSTHDVHANANAHANANDDVHSNSRIRNAQPVILLSRGRSGSSVFWSTISKLAGQRNTAWESTGSNQTHSKIFFEETLQKDPSMGYDWAIEKLCYIQQDRPDITPEAGIVGFQWKPFMNTFHHEYAIEGLRAIAAQKDPIVKIIYLTRNLLDRKASNLRHDASKHKHKRGSGSGSGSGSNTHEHVSNGGDSISAHCNVGDTECIKKHSQFDHDIVFPTGDALLKWLRKNMNDERTIQKRLEELQIQYVQVSYEELFIKNALDDNGNGNDNSSKAEEWMRVFRFLDVGPKYGLTMADVRASFTMASTHTKSRNETIANYELVKETLVGTEFEHLLN